MGLFSELLNLILREYRKEIFQVISPKEGDKILDIGCGDGNQLFYIKKKLKRVFLFGIDLKKKAILKGKKKIEKNNLKDIHLKVADAREVPFNNNYFDCVLISLMIHENRIRDAQKIIFEVKRVLKNGGTLVIADFNSPLPNNFLAKIIKLIELFVGRENYKNFKNYLFVGGIDYFLKNENFDKITFFPKNQKIIKIIRWKK